MTLSEEEVLHARDSVGQTSGATQRCLNPGFSKRIGIRDAQDYRTWYEKLLKLDGMPCNERKELRRSLVRVLVTYLAAAYLFIGGPIFCYFLFNHAVDANGMAVPGIEDAKNLYMSILPISSSILAYWFATRSSGAQRDGTLGKDKGVNNKQSP